MSRRPDTWSAHEPGTTHRPGAAVAASQREFGPDHPDTLSARHELALTYLHVGFGNGDARLSDAIGTMERAAECRVNILGTAHPDTLGPLASLALLYHRAGRHDEVSALRQRIAAGWEEIVAERERRLGPVHPDTVDAREHHAYCHRWIGRAQDEVSLVEQITADHQRLLGPTHPRTLRAQVQLAVRYLEGDHDTAGAIALGERIIDDVRAVLGAEHDDPRDVRAVLMVGYATTGRTNDAIALTARYPLPEDSAPE